MAVPSAGFNPFIGQSSEFTIGLFANDANMDFQNTSVMPTRTALTGNFSWTIDPSIDSAKFMGSGSPIDAYGVLYPLAMKGGIMNWTVTINGTVNGNSGTGLSTFARLVHAAFAGFDLYFNKFQPYGYIGCIGKIKQISSGADMKNTGDPSAFSCQIEGHGALPIPSFS